MLINCGNCGWWIVAADGYEKAAQCGLGKCQAAINLWDHTEWSDDMEHRIIIGKEDTMMFTQDGSDYHAELLTRPQHYCSSWKPSSQPTPPPTPR